MSERNDGGSAFPVPGLSDLPNGQFLHPMVGMSLRQYAAIKLRVPDSGIDWLDDMIRQSLRDEAAAKAMPVVWREIPEDTNRETALRALGLCTYEMADAMLAAREGS
ncbi:hypothetical protein ABRY94_11940 [Castellaniella ginsengisoli]|uniref:Uncharacterized protein n=1 Tax=Castellaniella ginsengisoli TaxID=546114 RepID=A0AB39EP42_9BURK